MHYRVSNDKEALLNPEEWCRTCTLEVVLHLMGAALLIFDTEEEALTFYGMALVHGYEAKVSHMGEYPDLVADSVFIKRIDLSLQ